MSSPATIAQAILDTVIGRLALLFLAAAAGDMTAAREAASQMLAAYNAETPEELSLATEIISFQLHALEALACAADPDLSLNKILRLRGSAVSLSRESHKARRKLDQLQRARSAGPTAQPAEATAPPQSQSQPAAASPRIERALGVIEAARNKSRGETWSQSLQKRQTAKRLAEKLKKQQARPTSPPHLNIRDVTSSICLTGTVSADKVAV